MIAVIENPQDLVALNIRSIPRDLRKRFKMLCAERELPMEQVLVSVIKRMVDGKLELPQ